jgi:hypothetical protein
MDFAALQLEFVAAKQPGHGDNWKKIMPRTIGLTIFPNRSPGRNQALLRGARACGIMSVSSPRTTLAMKKAP